MSEHPEPDERSGRKYDLSIILHTHSEKLQNFLFFLKNNRDNNQKRINPRHLLTFRRSPFSVEKRIRLLWQVPPSTDITSYYIGD